MNQAQVFVAAGLSVLGTLAFLGAVIYGDRPDYEPATAPAHASTAQPQGDGPLTLDAADYTELLPGLLAHDIVLGTGDEVTEGRAVRAQYQIWLEDGTRVEGSFGVTELVAGHVGGVEGFYRGVIGMRSGGKRQLHIAPALGWGERARRRIPANSSLILQVEVESVGGIRIGPTTMPTPDDAQLKPGEQGIRYHDLVIGTGAEVLDRSAVTVDMTVYKRSGEKVLSTYENASGPQMVVGTGAMLAAADLALLGMREGGSRFVEVPGELAYKRKFSNVEAGEPLYMQFEVHEVGKQRLLPDTPHEVRDEQWVVTDSGLKMFDVTEGAGEIPNNGDKIYVDYTGWIASTGEIFETSMRQIVPLNYVHDPDDRTQMVAGWVEGVSTMKKGGKRQLYLPSKLAFGAAGKGRRIGGDEDIIFLLELVDIERK